MTNELILAAHALGEVLLAENAALAAHDHAAATALLGDKQRLIAAFDRALAGTVPLLDGPARDEVRAVGLELQALAGRNVALLEQAMEVQARVIGIVAEAARQQVRVAAPGYGRPGRPVPAARPDAHAMVARA